MKVSAAENQGGDSPATNVVPFVKRAALEHAEPLLTDAERRELRAMLEAMRELRPKMEKVLATCPAAKAILRE